MLNDFFVKQSTTRFNRIDILIKKFIEIHSLTILVIGCVWLSGQSLNNSNLSMKAIDSFVS